MQILSSRVLTILTLCGACLVLAQPAWSAPTEITVRVISRDAKFVGTSMGGVLVTLRDADTGELLAEGTTQGGTGDTDRIMGDRKHGMSLATPDAAKFSTTIDLDEPRRIEVSAFGPLAQRQGTNRVSATQWVVPGKHLTGGDGWLIEMPGFIVDVLKPPTHVKLAGLPKTIPLRANVTMMCGCPVTPDGHWDANRYEVGALLKRNGEPAGEATLSYGGAASQFEGSVTVDQPGAYEATVYAYDPRTGNTGVDHVTFVVSAD